MTRAAASTAGGQTTDLVAGRYRLRGELDGGDAGIVWDAYDELLHRDVTVKEIRLPGEVEADVRERMTRRALQEARAVAALDTTAAVRVFDVVEQNGHPWVVMEVVRGSTLAELLGGGRRLDAADAARVGLAVLEALEVAHRAGVEHCRVTPANVIIGGDGRIALTDFCVDYADHETTVPAEDLEALGTTLRAALPRRPGRQLTDLVDALTGSQDRPTPESVRATLEQVLRESRGHGRGSPSAGDGRGNPRVAGDDQRTWPLLVALLAAIAVTAVLASTVLGSAG